MSTFEGQLEQKLGDVHAAAWVRVRIVHGNGFNVRDALIDTGADQTLVPALVLLALQAPPISEIDILDANGGRKTELTYRVDSMELPGYTAQNMEVAPTPWDFVLIGRDVLNDLEMTWDGPRLAFTLLHPGGASAIAP